MGQGPAAAGKDARREIFDWPAPGPVGRRHPLFSLWCGGGSQGQGIGLELLSLE